MSVCLTLSFYPSQHPSQRRVRKLCTQIWVCTVLLLVSASESALLVLSSTVLVCQQVFPPLGCVSLPNLLCCSSQLLNQKWVQVLCTPICVCTVVIFVIVCYQYSHPLGCVSLPDLSLYSNQPPSQRNGCKSYALKSVCSTVLVCPQEFPPPGCVSLPDLHVMCQRSGQKRVHLHSELYVYYYLTSKFA